MGITNTIDSMIKMLSLFLLSFTTTLVSSMSTTTTTVAPPQPGPDATLQEVWDWMVSVAGSQDEGRLNINMWMSGNKMSMQDTFFSMNVGEEAVSSSRSMTGDSTLESDGLVSWTWSPDQAGGSINMYMYNNTMSMTNTNFSMDTDLDNNMEFPSDRMTAVGGGREVNINMYMYDNDMSMDNTVFTMKVNPYSRYQ